MKYPMRIPGVAALTMALCGCGATQVTPKNRHLVESLATAVSAKNPEWLDENARLIEGRRTTGNLAAAEDSALSAIVVLAEAGDWAKAEELALALRDGQRPSSQDVATAAKPKLRKPQQYAGSAPIKGRKVEAEAH